MLYPYEIVVTSDYFLTTSCIDATTAFLYTLYQFLYRASTQECFPEHIVII